EARGAGDAAQLAAVELEAPPTRPAGKQREPTRLPYRKFTSQTGAPILIGRSARDNDALTLRVAHGNDLWLHARGVQGAHVIVPGAGESPDARTLADAALLALHFSSARGQDGAEVAWTRRKHVRKPKGAAPGSVFVTQEKVLRIRLEEDRLAALLRTEACDRTSCPRAAPAPIPHLPRRRADPGRRDALLHLGPLRPGPPPAASVGAHSHRRDHRRRDRHACDAVRRAAPAFRRRAARHLD